MSSREREASRDPADDFLASLSPQPSSEDSAPPPAKDEILKEASESLPPLGWRPPLPRVRDEFDRSEEYFLNRLRTAGIGMLLAFVFILARICWEHFFG